MNPETKNKTRTYYHNESFSDFKNRFYSRIDDLNIFDCAEFNLLKVVLDGLKVKYHKRADMHGRKELDSILFFPVNYVKHFKIKKILNRLIKELELFKNKEVLVGFDRRSFIQDGKRKSVYFNNIIETIGREKVLFISNRRNDELNLESDLYAEDIQAIYPACVFSPAAKKLRQELLSAIDKISSTGIFDETELFDIKYAIQKFYYEYLSWDFIFKRTSLKSVILVAHYHREGFMLAAKRNGVKIIEVQHGLIAKEDIFYVLPTQVRSIASRALFSDKMLVYGPYWKSLLLQGGEFEKQQIETLGYYQADINSFTTGEESKLDEIVRGKNSLLITTQTFIHDFFIQYVKKQAETLKENQIIIVKPHPSEDIKVYDQLKKIKNVYVLFFNVHLLLKRCDIHVTVFSTTIFDALKAGKKSGCLPMDVFNDYIESIVSLGIARRMTLEENPFEIEEIGKQKIALSVQSEYYQSYQPAVLLSELKGQA